LVGTDLKPGMSEKEVELLLWDQGFLANRDVWNACEELELQVRIAISKTKLKIQVPNAVFEHDGGSNGAIEHAV
jgi:hypothetical protein